MKKILIPLVIVILLAAGGYGFYAYRSAQTAQAAGTAYETAPLSDGDLTVIISAVGKVRANQTATLNWETSGTVEKVDVAVGDSVKAGQQLASLAQTSLPQSVITAQADLASAQQALEDLNTKAEASKVSAMQDIVTYEQDLRDAQYQLDNFTIPSNMAGMDAVDALAAMKKNLDTARKAFEPYKYLSSNDATRTDRLEDLNTAQADYNTAVKRLQYEYDLSVAQANLDKAQRDYAKWKNGPLPADLEAAKAKVAAAEATLSQAYIEAPFDGVITVSNPKVGDQVSASTAAFQIDDLKALFVDVDVSEIDINQVKVGQAAALTFDAIQDKKYSGQVVEVGMTGKESSSVVNYTVTVQVDDADQSVRPGMTAQVDITTAQKQNVLLTPNQAVQIENGKTVIYIMKPGQPKTAVPVTLGLANETSTEILSGDVKAGDLVVLNPTDTTATTTRMRGMFGGGPPPGEGPRDNGGGNSGGGGNNRGGG